MKIKLSHYASNENGMSLQICPESDIEFELLRSFYAHGEMKIGHPCKASYGTGFYINWKPKEENPE